MRENIRLGIIFPGQGSQFPGMGEELYSAFDDAQEIFRLANEVLERDLMRIMFNGTSEELKLTINAQPSIAVVSLAIIQVILKKLGLVNISSFCDVCAGHSLGEYTALCAAGTISLKDIIFLIGQRAKAMYEVNVGGAMIALLGATQEIAEDLAFKGSTLGVCEVANDNGAGQIVLSGEVKAIENVHQIASDMKNIKSIILPVSAAFHSTLMDPVVKVFSPYLSRVGLQNPMMPVIANYTAQEYKDTKSIEDGLIKQICGKVRWRESIERMVNTFGVNTIAEIGPGTVLSGLIKRMRFDREIKVLRICTIREIEDFIKNVQFK